MEETMGRLGEGYGSEYHLRRYLAVAPATLSAAIADEIGDGDRACEWLPFGAGKRGDRELRGMEFLDPTARGAWADFWSRTGTPPNWDAVGRRAGIREWVLVEAKAREGELVSPPCGAKEDGGRARIEQALRAARRHFGVADDRDWMGSYYQIANRLASLYFLTEIAKQPARLVFLYFVGDTFPDGSRCPASRADWEPLVAKANGVLGLPTDLDRVHHVFLPVL
ncbi:MAG: hypothetical protein E6J90_16535 [Deltaproteobacteria bacterium]|nr:MAG: hypothetical protein E6J91_16665 [Deltaproteobacteria bacterium]TMQ20321.1 MAG: hypothetical protein E6J90_16535 [Deltaproteobacteria bacterium]